MMLRIMALENFRGAGVGVGSFQLQPSSIPTLQSLVTCKNPVATFWSMVSYLEVVIKFSKFQTKQNKAPSLYPGFSQKGLQVVSIPDP